MNLSAILTHGFRDFRKDGLKLLFLLLVVLLSLNFAGCTGVQKQQKAAEPGAETYNITIFHTNDAHSFFLPRPAVWRDDGKLVGGVIPLAWHLDQQRSSTQADLFLDAGDFMTGNPVCQIAENGVPGEAVAGMMNLLKYDAGTVGNHEFDIGVDNLRQLVPLFEFPLIAADILDDQGQPIFRSEPLIVEKNGLKIGVMGVSCGEMTEVVAPSRFKGLTNADQVEIVRRQAAKLDPKTDLMILITHNGVDNDMNLAEALAGSGVDVIVGGHSHSRLKKPRVQGDILVVQAGSKWTNLGRLDLQVEDDKVVRYNGRLITLWADNCVAGPELTALVQDYETQVAEKFGRQIGVLASDWRKGRGESNLGNFLADKMRDAGQADVGFVNSGGIRKSMQAGPITALDINEMLPFSNSLVTMKLQGAQLATIIQANADAQVGGKHGILQVSGVAYQFRAAAGGDTAQIEEILVGGQPLAMENEYIIALPDYVVMMADVYLNIEVPLTQDAGVTMTEAVVNAILASGPIDSKIEGRIMRLDQQ